MQTLENATAYELFYRGKEMLFCQRNTTFVGATSPVEITVISFLAKQRNITKKIIKQTKGTINSVAKL